MSLFNVDFAVGDHYSKPGAGINSCPMLIYILNLALFYKLANKAIMGDLN